MNQVLKLVCIDSRPDLLTIDNLVEGASYLFEAFIKPPGMKYRVLLKGKSGSFPFDQFLTQSEDKEMNDFIFEMNKTKII